MKNFARCDCDAAASALEREISSPAAWRSKATMSMDVD